MHPVNIDDLPYKKLRELMIERGLTHEAVSDKLGITKTTFSRKINGQQPFKTVEIYKLVAFLKIPKNDIYDYFFQELDNNTGRKT